MLLMGHFLAVRIIENHANVLAWQQLIIVVLLIHAQANALVLDGLAGTIDGAVGEENGLRGGRRILRQIRIELILGAEFLAMMARAQQIAPLLRGRETEESIFVGSDLRL